jgi:hypothetical protein
MVVMRRLAITNPPTTDGAESAAWLGQANLGHGGAGLDDAQFETLRSFVKASGEHPVTLKRPIAARRLHIARGRHYSVPRSLSPQEMPHRKTHTRQAAWPPRLNVTFCDKSSSWLARTDPPICALVSVGWLALKTRPNDRYVAVGARGRCQSR